MKNKKIFIDTDSTLNDDQLRKIRRKIEDYLRKTNDSKIILLLANSFKIKTD
jgi:hypothetical protein